MKRAIIEAIREAAALEAECRRNGLHLTVGNPKYEAGMKEAGRAMLGAFYGGLRMDPMLKGRLITGSTVRRRLLSPNAPRWWPGLLAIADYPGSVYGSRMLIDWATNLELARLRHRRQVARREREEQARHDAADFESLPGGGDLYSQAVAEEAARAAFFGDSDHGFKREDRRGRSKLDWRDPADVYEPIANAGQLFQ